MQFVNRLCAAFVAVATVAGCSGSGQTVEQVATDEGEAWVTLFDGTGVEGWTMAGPGSFALEDGTLRAEGGMGLFYYAERPFRDFVLELEWMVEDSSDNSGIFVRFPEQTDDPWYAVENGYEIQIADGADPLHMTGAVYDTSAAFKGASLPPGEWNAYRIQVTGQRYEIFLNGEKVNDFFGDRGREGYIGLQNHDDASQVRFRNIRVQTLPDLGYPERLADLLKVEEERDPIRVLVLTATHGFRHGPAIETSKALLATLNETTEFEFEVTEDLSVLAPERLQNYDLLFFNNSTLRLRSEPSTAAVGAGGSLGTYELVWETPQGTFPLTLILDGTPDAPTGALRFPQAPSDLPIDDVVLDDGNLTFTFQLPDYGGFEGDLTLGGEVSGAISNDGYEMSVTGTAVAGADTPDADATAAVLTTGWDLVLATPDGDVDGRLTLVEGPDSLSGSIWFEAIGDQPLQELAMEDGAYTFTVDTGQFGTVPGTISINEQRLNGNVVVQGGTLQLTGTRTEFSGGAETEEYVSEAQRQAVLDFLRDGKGVVAAHAGLDAFYDWDAYREMMGGGLFESHPWTQSVGLVIEEPDNPAVAHLDTSFAIRDEIYVLDENPRWNSHVLMSLDMETVEAEGDPRGNYRNDYPISWIRNHNGGRVFVTKLGHFPDVWTTPAYLEHLLQGMRMAAGRIDADFSGRLVKETIAENVWPDDIAVDDQGNVWIAELRGKVHRYDAQSGETELIAEVPTTDPTKIEHGLYGIEVDPAFYNGEPYIYLYYAERETFINTLSRFVYRDGRIDLASEQVLLRVPTEPQCCHQAGDLEWGPDGTLYLSTGDTGMSETRPDWELTEEELEAFQQKNDLEEYQWSRLADSERSAQNLQDLRGKILRINKDGSIPKDNPFYGEPGVRWEVYAYGLRNPYRFKVDPENGYLYIGVVGPDAQFDYDEYNISTEGGENFGWPREIGKLVYNEWRPDLIPNYRPPIWEYTYETGGRSASGGPIYRHTGEGAFPPIFQGRLLVYDWSRRWLKWGKLEKQPFVLEKTNGETFEFETYRLTDVKTMDVLEQTSPISMELGPDGAIYVAEFTGFWDAAPGANVSRYRWVSGNESPIGKAEAVPEGDGSLKVRFFGAGSYDPNADAIRYAWDFGDGRTSDLRDPEHTYAAAGRYSVTLTVTDEEGRESAPVRLEVAVGPATEAAGVSEPDR